jgi:hypothetical protein
MMSSFMLSALVSLCVVMMGLSVASTPGSSHILWITQRSTISFPPFAVTFLVHFIVRVLLATIRDQGLCPCPRCLVPKSKLDQVGRITDTKNRINKARIYPADAVNKAWKMIYDQGIPITGAAIQRLLKNTSTVPTLVRPRSSCLCRS